MWTRLDDDLLHHDKTEDAGRAFGGRKKRGLFVALGTVAFGLLYANWKLTDGFLHDDTLERYGVDKDQRDVMERVGFWSREQDGYRIHDFHELNPTAAAVKEKRARDRKRKQSRAGFRVESGAEGESDSNAESTSRVPRPAPPLPTDPPVAPQGGQRLTKREVAKLRRAGVLRDEGPSWRERCRELAHGHCNTLDVCTMKQRAVAS